MSVVSEKKKQRNIKPNRLVSTKQKDTVQKNAYKNVKSIEKRIDFLDEIEPRDARKPIIFPTAKNLEMHNRFPVMGQNITISFDNVNLFNNLNFQFPVGEKIAIIGENGSGKTTLLNYIYDNNEGVTLSKKTVFSIYKQMDYKLIADMNILDYLTKISDYPKDFVRSILYNLGFNSDDFQQKKLNSLSGGEATRISIASIFVRPSNVLILDEPTNFIDLPTIKALEDFIKSYKGTVILTSHDNFFVEMWQLRYGQ